MSYRKIPAAAVLLILTCSVLWAGDHESYGNIADFLNNIYGIDSNAGLTTFPILNIPMGGRSEGMGNAFSALADDVSFIEYNPAGSSMLARSELAFFHNNWIAGTNLEGIVYAGRLNNLGFAAGIKWLYTPFTEYNIHGDRVSGGYYSEGVTILNVSYNFFPSYYFSGLSLGMNLKGAFRLVPDYAGEDDAVIPGSGLSQSAVMAMADFGILTRFNFLKFYTSRENNMSAALVLRNLGPPALDEPLPTVFISGISYKPVRPLVFAFDFGLPINLQDTSLSEKPFYAVGVSGNLTNFLSLHSGLMIKAGSSRVTVGSAINLNNITIDINYTMDMLTQFQPLNRLSLGVRFDLGDGGRQQQMDSLNELYLLGIDAYLAGDLSQARYFWEEALKIDFTYSPAREGITWLTDREELQQRLEDLFRLDF